MIQVYIPTYLFFFQILFPLRLLQNIEYSSLCYTVGLQEVAFEWSLGWYFEQQGEGTEWAGKREPKLRGEGAGATFGQQRAAKLIGIQGPAEESQGRMVVPAHLQARALSPYAGHQIKYRTPVKFEFQVNNEHFFRLIKSQVLHNI